MSSSLSPASETVASCYHPARLPAWTESFGMAKNDRCHSGGAAGFAVEPELVQAESVCDIEDLVGHLAVAVLADRRGVRQAVPEHFYANYVKVLAQGDDVVSEGLNVATTTVDQDERFRVLLPGLND